MGTTRPTGTMTARMVSASGSCTVDVKETRIASGPDRTVKINVVNHRVRFSVCCGL